MGSRLTVSGTVRSALAPGRNLLVTGVPRSGTTWLARLLAQATGTAMPGREPMNPHVGQYRLGGTLSAWTRLQDPTPRQQRSLRRAYRGVEPRVYGRYGHRTWAAPLPVTRVIVKDPFALLSIPAVRAITGARTVLVYRHPGAVLASYRRMGWQPDVEEIVRACPELASLAPDPTADLVEQMGFFWQACHEVALGDANRELPPDALVIVSHEELTAGGVDGVRRLFDACALPWSCAVAQHVTSWSRPTGSQADAGGPLHVLDRSPREVGTAWRAAVEPEELERLEAATRAASDGLHARRLSLSPGDP